MQPQAPPTTRGETTARPGGFKTRHVFAVIGGVVVLGATCLFIAPVVLWLFLAVSLMPRLWTDRDAPLPQLHLAVEQSDDDAVLAQLEGGDAVDLGAVGNPHWSDGTTPLMIAVHQGDNELAALLLSRGAQVNAMDRHRSTALHVASAETIHLLIEHGADLELQDRWGRTPLFDASVGAQLSGDLSRVKALLEAGANRRARDDQGRTAADVVRTWSDANAELLELLDDPADAAAD